MSSPASSHAPTQTEQILEFTSRGLFIKISQNFKILSMSSDDYRTSHFFIARISDAIVGVELLTYNSFSIYGDGHRGCCLSASFNEFCSFAALRLQYQTPAAPL